MARVDLICKSCRCWPPNGIPLCAVLRVALYVVPTGAHLAELPNKIGVPSEQYMLAQGIYEGWNLFGFAGLGALILMAAHTIGLRGNRRLFLLAHGLPVRRGDATELLAVHLPDEGGERKLDETRCL